MRKLLLTLLPCAAVAAVLTGCGEASRTAVLRGVIEGGDAPESVQVAYTTNGDMLDMTYAPVEVDADGTFTFRLELPERTLDVDIYVGDGAYGAHLRCGKECVVRLTPAAGGYGYKAEYEGPDAELSRAVDGCTRAFDIMKYFSIDPAYAKTADEYRQLLDDEYAALKPLVEGISDARMRDYYTRLAEGRYRWTRLRILMDEAYDCDRPLTDYPEYAEMLEGVDVNDPMTLRTNMIFPLMDSKHTLPNDFGSDMTDYCIESMEIVDREITNPVVRRSQVRNVAYSFFTYYAAGSDVARFWERYKEFAAEYPDLIAEYEPRVGAYLSTAAGSPVPCDPVLTDIEGRECRLSEFAAGKFAYIDIWATWCGPCRKEIPHFARVAEHFRGNDKVCIMSISVDSDREAWEKMISAEKPAWPQFIMDDVQQRAFMEAWGIGGIPRFIMLDRDGRIFAADAMRPSDEQVIATIEAEL